MEASRSLGIGYLPTMRKVILPQAIRTMIPSYINQFVITLKDTSILSVIGIAELTQTGRIIIAGNYQSFKMWLIIGIIYFIVIMALTKLSDRLEKRISEMSRSRPRGRGRRARRHRQDPHRGPEEVVRRPGGAQRHRHHHQPRRSGLCHRAVRFRQVDLPALPEQAGGHHRRHGGRRRIRPDRQEGQPRQGPPAHRHGVPALQPLPAHDGDRERHAGAAADQEDGQGGSGEEGARTARSGGAGGEGAREAGHAVGRAEAARRDRPGTGDEPVDHAVRRGHQRAGSRDGRRRTRGAARTRRRAA